MRKRYTQIKLPSPDDHDPHPRLLVDGYGIHAGETFRARFPDGWHDITLEVAWEVAGPGCWYISTPAIRTCARWGCSWRRDCDLWDKLENSVGRSVPLGGRSRASSHRR